MAVGPESRSYGEAPSGMDPSKPYAGGDAVAMYEQREHVVRQKLVKVETAKARHARTPQTAAGPTTHAGA